jgi:hypothetical protein
MPAPCYEQIKKENILPIGRTLLLSRPTRLSHNMLFAAGRFLMLAFGCSHDFLAGIMQICTLPFFFPPSSHLSVKSTKYCKNPENTCFFLENMPIFFH